jgi:fructose 1,6-bisphosphatase
MHLNPHTKEIVIHDKNVVDDAGKQNEQCLVFTAIHELARRVVFVEKGGKSSHAHSREFWAAFHDLLDVAEKKGLYRAEIDAETKNLVDEARGLSRCVAALQREPGRVLLALGDSYRKNGLREENVLERKARISKQTAGVTAAASVIG